MGLWEPNSAGAEHNIHNQNKLKLFLVCKKLNFTVIHKTLIHITLKIRWGNLRGICRHLVVMKIMISNY